MTDRPLPELLTPAEAAAAFKVDPKTVSRWAKEGRLRSIRTLGASENYPGHRRFYAAQVHALLAGKPLTDAELDELIQGGAS